VEASSLQKKNGDDSVASFAFRKKNLNVPLVLVDIIIVDMYIYIADSNVLPINEFQQQCQVKIYIYEDSYTDTHTTERESRMSIDKKKSFFVFLLLLGWKEE
jgi:hypothetical protein